MGNTNSQEENHPPRPAQRIVEALNADDSPASSLRESANMSPRAVQIRKEKFPVKLDELKICPENVDVKVTSDLEGYVAFLILGQ